MSAFPNVKLSASTREVAQAVNHLLNGPDGSERAVRLVNLKSGVSWAAENLGRLTSSFDELSAKYGGGTVLLPAGTYDFSDQITAGDGTDTTQSTKHHNIRIIGAGSASSPSVSNVQTTGITVLRYAGSADSSKAVFEFAGPMHAVHIEHVELDANGLAGIGLKTTHVDAFTYREVVVRNWTANSYVWTTRSGFPSGVAHGCGNGSVYDCFAYDPASNAANGLLLTSGVDFATTLVGNPDTANMDIYGGVFFYGGSTGSSGIEFAGCDNNSYNGSQFIPAGGNDGGGHSHKWTQWTGSPVFPLGNELQGGGFSQAMTGTAGTGGNFAWFDTSDSGYVPNISGLSAQTTDGKWYFDGALVVSSNSLTLTELAAASVSTPDAGRQTLFIDTADHKLKRKDSSGTVTVIA